MSDSTTPRRTAVVSRRRIASRWSRPCHPKATLLGSASTPVQPGKSASAKVRFTKAGRKPPKPKR